LVVEVEEHIQGFLQLLEAQAAVVTAILLTLQEGLELQIRDLLEALVKRDLTMQAVAVAVQDLLVPMQMEAHP
jgi:hypothetical protein